MFSRLRTHLTYANVISTLCLVLVLGGGAAYAANTVLSSDIVDGEVKTADLANNAVRGTKIANAQIQSIDVKDAGLTGADVADGSLTGDDIHSPSLGGENVRDDSLTGFQIDESTLNLPNVQERAVPIDFEQPDTDNTLREIAYQNGLHLLAQCDEEDPPSSVGSRLRLFATSDFDASSHSTFQAQTFGTSTSGDPLPNFFSIPQDHAEALHLTALAPPQPLYTPDESSFGIDVPNGTVIRQAMAQTVFRNSQAVISLDLTMLVNGRTDVCQAYGTMLSATSVPG